MTLPTKHLEEIHTLWDELAEFPAARADNALLHLMEGLASKVEANNMIWVGAGRLGQGAEAHRDGQLGWRALVARHWQATPEILGTTQRLITDQDTEPSLTSQAMARKTGQWQVHRLRDGWIDLDAFRRTRHYQISYAARGITDRMFLSVPINPDAEVIFLIDRYDDAPRFNKREAEIAAYTMRGLKWFHRELMLSLGLILAGGPLSPTQQRIVSLLLTERSEKEIAAELGQSPKTTHKYITEILRSYGVSGRTGLMALWLNRGG